MNEKQVEELKKVVDLVYLPNTKRNIMTKRFIEKDESLTVRDFNEYEHTGAFSLSEFDFVREYLSEKNESDYDYFVKDLVVKALKKYVEQEFTREYEKSDKKAETSLKNFMLIFEKLCK